MARASQVKVENLVMFQLADLPGEGLALLLAHATSQASLSKGELETYVIGMTKEKASELGKALLEKAGAPPAPQKPRKAEH